MEFVTHRREDGTFQPLKEHIENVGERAAQFAAAFDAAEHGREAGLLHDIGKYSSKGQKRQRDPEHTAKVDHSSAGAQEAFRRKDPMAAFAVAGHHGGLPDFGSRGDTDGGTLCSRLNKPLTGGDDPSAWKQEIVLPSSIPMPSWAVNCQEGRVQALYTRMLFSCLVDADFLDTEAALQGRQPRGGYASLEELLQKLQSHVAPWLKEPKNELCAKRSAILQSCLQGGEREEGLYTLTVPTGGGKTVSSLAFALTHAVRHDMKRVVYVIPYTSIIEQNAKVFAEILGEENVLEHHSQTELADETGDAETPDARRRRLACENWDAPVIVTTAVQFFESLYAAKTSRCRKLHNLAGSVVIFDEAQTLPVPYLKPCVSAIGELVRHYGVTAVLCTATQPELGRLFNELAPELSIREIAPEPDELFEFFRRVSFQREGQLSNEELAARLTETEQVLCIVNTRKRAREIFQLLPEEGRFHLSTLMTPQDRKRVLAVIKKRLEDEKTCRVVATSLVEAGVDVDFPTVWREVAGLDSILQAAGRCNREGKNPAEESIVHVFRSDGRAPDMIELNVTAAESVLHQFEEINTRPAIRAYFQQLLWAKGDAALDEKRILESESAFAFRDTAEKFHLIDKNTLTIYIPSKADSGDIQALRDKQFSKGLLRRLSQSAVNLYDTECQKLMENGALEMDTEDGYVILLNPKMYSDECGLEICPEGGEGFFA